jgi:hypothetical protein
LADLKKSSSLKPLGQMNRNLIGSIYGMSSIKIAHFVPIRLQTWPPQAILVSDWLISKKASPLKPLGQMNRNLVGDDARRTTSDGKSSHCLWQGELKKIINLTQQFLTRNFLEKLLIFSCKKIILFLFLVTVSQFF